MKKSIRHWAIRNGLIAPKDTRETREVFKFPDATDKHQPIDNHLWLNLNVRRVL